METRRREILRAIKFSEISDPDLEAEPRNCGKPERE